MPLEIFGLIFSVCLDVMRTEFSVWGFTLSLWMAFVFAAVLGVVFWIVWEVILGGR